MPDTCNYHYSAPRKPLTRLEMITELTKLHYQIEDLNNQIKTVSELIDLPKDNHRRIFWTNDELDEKYRYAYGVRIAAVNEFNRILEKIKI